MTTTTARREGFLRRWVNRFRALDSLTKTLFVLFLVLGIASSVVAFNYVNFLTAHAPSHALPGLALSDDGQPQTPEEAVRSQNIFSYVSPQRWDGASRINVLVMGLDARDWEVGQGAPRTDTMIVLTYDPVSNTAGMLSVPRDLWVEIPGFGHEKINNAYALGEGSRLPGGGAGLAVKTVEQLLGITINYYAQIDFVAFERFIDIIGGVKLDIPTDTRVEVIGDQRTNCPPGGCTLIPSGRQVLNGQLALAYARARHKGDGDFDRSSRQQEVILAMREQLARDDVRAVVLNNLLNIYNELSGGINTNMGVEEALSLAWSVKDVKIENIRRGVLGPNACQAAGCIGKDYVTISSSPDGLSILKPVSQNIRLLRDEIFSVGTVRSPLAASSEATDLMKMEAAQVSIFNGSGQGGLAESTKAYLEGRGMLIASVNSADNVGGTLIYDYTGNPYTVQYLATLMGVNSARIYSRYDPNSAVDVEVVLGPEWVVPAQ